MLKTLSNKKTSVRIGFLTDKGMVVCSGNCSILGRRGWGLIVQQQECLYEGERVESRKCLCFSQSNSTGFEVEFDSSLILQPGGLANLLFIKNLAFGLNSGLSGMLNVIFTAVTLSLMWQTIILLDTQNVIRPEKYLKRNLKPMNNQGWICQLLVFWCIPLTEWDITTSVTSVIMFSEHQ